MTPSQGRNPSSGGGALPMDHRMTAARLLALLLACTGGQAFAAPAAEGLIEIETEIGFIEGAANRLEARLAVKAPPQSTASQMAQINAGLVYHQLGDHKRAALLLLRIVDVEPNTEQPLYKDALFFLAEALYEDRNYAAAESYFREVLERNYQDYNKHALLRLIEIASETGRQRHIDKYFALLTKNHGLDLDPKFAYLHGRALYERGRIKQAMARFMSVPRGSDSYLQARYLAAVAHVSVADRLSRRRGKPEAIRQQFDQAAQLLANALKDQPPKTDDERSVAQLAHLTLGRIYYEVGKFAESVGHYQQVPRGSEWFDHALYEVCWTYVKNKEYGKALRALDILLLALPNSPFAAEAQVVRGNLQLQLEEYDEASDTFSKLRNTF